MSEDARQQQAEEPDAFMVAEAPGGARPAPARSTRRGSVPAADDAPLLDELMPWSVGPLRLGRAWVRDPDPAALRARWTALTGAAGEKERAALFRPSRARSLRSSVAPLPGRPAPGSRLVDERGPCPEPVRVRHGPYDRQWLLPDHRLLDAARPELWRVTDEAQIHLVEAAQDASLPGPALTFTGLLPDGHSPAARPGRVRPLYRRPGGREPNLAPGLTTYLARRLGVPVSAEDVLAWTAVVAGDHGGPERGTGRRPAPHRVPLTADTALWERGVALGRRALWVHTRGARGRPEPGAASGARPRLPGGQRPYVRAPLPDRPAPDGLRYDAEGAALCVGPGGGAGGAGGGEGRLAPVDRAAWEFTSCGVPVLETWYAARTGPAQEPGALAGVRPAGWLPEWTSELLELVTTLTLLARLRPECEAVAGEAAGGPVIGDGELRRAGVLPPPAAARRPASVLDLREEGPDGQLALL